MATYLTKIGPRVNPGLDPESPHQITGCTK